MTSGAGRLVLGCALPLLGGSLFWLTVKVEHWLVARQMLSVRGAIGVELIVFPVCLFLIFAGAGVVLRTSGQRLSVRIMLASAAAVAGLAMIVQAFDSGAALLWAT